MVRVEDDPVLAGPGREQDAQGGELRSGGATDRNRARTRASSSSSAKAAVVTGSQSGCAGTSHAYRRHHTPGARRASARGCAASAAAVASRSARESRCPATRTSTCTLQGSAGAS